MGVSQNIYEKKTYKILYKSDQFYILKLNFLYYILSMPSILELILFLKNI
jgi:hypothetical protein